MANRRGLRLVVFLFLFHSNLIWSIEFKPWIGNYLEIEAYNSILHQRYQKLAVDSSFVSYRSTDSFLSTSLCSTVVPDFSIQFELTDAFTRQQWGEIDHFSFAGRYEWTNDIWGDFLTFTSGFIFTKAFKNSLRDLSSFHHGKGEAEVFISVGKELSIANEEWMSRWWGTFGMGAAERGSPWIRGNLAYQFRVCPLQEWGFFINSLWGLGHKRIHINHFRGYGSIQHQSVDVGLSYTYIIKYLGNIELAYSYRPFARNFPAQTHLFLLSVYTSFGL